MWARTAAASGRKRACRSWLILSGPIVRFEKWSSSQETLAGEDPKKATPLPAMVIFEVEPKTNTRSGWPSSALRLRMSARGSSAPTWCTAYALSQKIRKSGAAVSMAASRRTVSGGEQTPVGVLYFGTHQMPLTRSSATSRSTSSRSGPSAVIGTGIMSMPSFSHSAKCRS